VKDQCALLTLAPEEIADTLSRHIFAVSRRLNLLNVVEQGVL
jgi:hypothetical protein